MCIRDSDITGAPVKATLLDEQLVIYRIKGQVVVARDVCPHLAGVKADMKHSFIKTGADYSSLLAQIRRICYIARLFNRSVSL